MISFRGNVVFINRSPDISRRRRKPGQDSTHFKTDEDTGKMVIDDVDTSDDENPKASTEIEGAAYLESITSVDGFTRGQNGKIKFHKDTKKRRREAEEAEDVEMVDRSVNTKRTKQKVPEIKLGHEFKAKVSFEQIYFLSFSKIIDHTLQKAGGDLKKKGIDPYAYLPLSQAATKGKRGRNKISIMGKK